MKPWMGAVVFLVCLLGMALFWWVQPTAPPKPASPTVRPTPRVLPKIAPRIYRFPRVPDASPPSDEAQVPLSTTVHRQLASATTVAVGAGWRSCILPWLEEHPVDDSVPSEPLVVFFDMVDGRLSDVRLRSPIELPDALQQCFAAAVWEHPFPEDENHRGSVSVQRVLTIKK